MRNRSGNDSSKKLWWRGIKLFHSSLFLYFIEINRNIWHKEKWKIHVLSKWLLTLRKIVKPIEKVATDFTQKTWKEVFQSLFYENSKNSRTSQVGKLFLTQKLSNTTICFAVLVFTQICNNFDFHELFSQNSLNTFIKKIKRLNGQLLKKPSWGHFSFFVFKNNSIENLRIITELLFEVPKYSNRHCWVLLILGGPLNHWDKLLLLISKPLFLPWYVKRLSCSLFGQKICWKKVHTKAGSNESTVCNSKL